jgi:poly(glycerol-phosphate) alpha-glucosyltransferase
MMDPWALNNQRFFKNLALNLFQRRQLTKEVDCIHAVCESELQSLRQFGCKSPICIVPNGLDLSSVDTDAANRSFSHARPPYILFLSRLHPKKNVEALVRGWSHFIKTGSKHRESLTLVLAGWDQEGYRDHLLQVADELRIPYAKDLESWTNEAKLVFAGGLFGESKAAALANCRAFILPSASEGLPIAVLEAWGYSKPVLITDACNLPEGFDQRAAIRIGLSQGIENGIADALSTFMNLGAVEQEDMGRKGLKLIEQRFCWPKTSDLMHEVYQWLLGQGKKPEFVYTHEETTRSS